ncbi:phosphoenolpyruvate phosphomutase-domain-containing protein [Microdochium trichocladiopsis]|uniref:Phosphoenolpyruvate phosphomutase-domain-containing protein n=1 Tax=Microdochium trichocladiopsis TaxID=1682393 RepID=A0A9P9BGF0_9PEZI|nr:phosphoenolpyruvate phosphomutase-domain-containing protein [Microdochium trichocladiopsis]KAH7014624.1 phosphoenolpyruvate phosphomutase-domain-containing protein [Microdochium trichocladiopsis]
MAQANTSAARLAALHAPGNPLVLPNVWDTTSLETITSINKEPSSSSSSSADSPGEGPLKAIATASYAIAKSLGIQDAELTFAQNLARIQELAPLVHNAGLPLSVDIQDGYGSKIEECVAAVVKAGAVGANIEDVVLASDDVEGGAGAGGVGVGGHKGGEFYGVEEQASRIRSAIRAAEQAGCPGFVVNARHDGFFLQGATGKSDEEVMAEAVTRGKAYLDAGATTVFFWGGSGRGLRTHEVQTLVKELGGRVAVMLGAKGRLSVKELADIGVARISVGPSLSFLSPGDVKGVAMRILGGGALVEICCECKRHNAELGMASASAVL